MRLYCQCGVCSDEQEVRGLTSVEQVMTVQYAFWARHDHPDWKFRAATAARVGVYEDDTEPAPAEDTEDGDA